MAKYPIDEMTDTKNRFFQRELTFLNKCTARITLEENVMNRVASSLVLIARKHVNPKNTNDNLFLFFSSFPAESPECRNAQELITPSNAHDRVLSCGSVLMSVGMTVKVQAVTTASRVRFRVSVIKK
jgi:hypothetical protein